MKRALLLGTLLAALAGGTAYADVANVFGNKGSTIHFDAACHRPSWTVTNKLTVREGQSVVAQQARCLVRRPDPFAQCVRKLGPAPTVKLYRKDDWKGVDKLQAYVAAVGACSSATY